LYQILLKTTLTYGIISQKGKKMLNTNLQEQLSNILNCDLKSLYPIARELKRKLYFFVGPTNSGKTHKAIEELKQSDTGIYLAPLRLLALENYEQLKSSNIPVSLITGEEEVLDEDAGHICSTIEMLNFNLQVDTAIIDEVQMLLDEDRGWAWVNAILGVPAQKVIMTGSVNALEIIKTIASYLDEELEIIKFKRKNLLQIDKYPTPLKQIKKHTALITFSRKDVLMLKNKLSKFFRVSVLYGNLSPEVRKEEAKRFRDGQSDILIATDAIAMGLNLPIKHIVFTTYKKFDGKQQRELLPNEVIQIAGRAGRYGHHEIGHIGAISQEILTHISRLFQSPLNTIKPPIYVKATYLEIERLSFHLKTTNLVKILQYYLKHMKYDGPFRPINIKTTLQLASILDRKKNLNLELKYILSNAPMNTKSILILNGYLKYIDAIINNQVIKYKPSVKAVGIAKTQLELLKAEDEIKKISLYLWLSYKIPNLFPDNKKANKSRIKLNQYCQRSLKLNKFLYATQQQPKQKPRQQQKQKKSNRRNHTSTDQRSKVTIKHL
jgi:ATP-dependent RNA helicase SUPV3L1/SUV3